MKGCMLVCVLLLALLCAVSLPSAEARLREGECEGPQQTETDSPRVGGHSNVGRGTETRR
jgi:hypothetical protein